MVEMSAHSHEEFQRIKAGVVGSVDGFSLLFFQELNVFQDSLQTLKIAKSKFAGSKDALEQIDESWQDKEILVPLTGSMYVPGVVKNIDKFIIDVGRDIMLKRYHSFYKFQNRFSSLRTWTHQRTISSVRWIMFRSKWTRLTHLDCKSRKF